MTRVSTLDRIATWLGAVVGLVAVALTALAGYVMAGAPTSLPANEYVLATVVFGALLAVVLYAAPSVGQRTDGGRRPT